MTSSIHPIPKPEPKEKRPRKQLRAKTQIARKTPVKKVNVEATRKRTKRYRAKWMSKDERIVRAKAFERARNRCEHIVTVGPYEARCRAEEGLEAHHLRYPKTRPLRASDLLVVCKPHHALLEAQYSYRRHGKVG